MKRVCVFLFVALLVVTLTPALAQDSRQPITPANAAQLAELIRLGRSTTEHVAFSPDGQTLAVASKIGVWLYSPAALDTASEPPLIATPKVAEAIAYSPDGALLAIASNSAVHLYDTAAGQIAGSVTLQRGSQSIAFSPDGALLAINVGSGGIILWDMAAGAEKAVIAANMQADAMMAFSPDGALLAGSTTDYSVHLWQVADGSEKAALPGHTRYVYDVAFSPDGATLASASYDKTVRLWDVVSGGEAGVLAGTEAQPLDEVYSLAFMDNMVLVSGHAKGRYAVWDAASQVLAAVIETGGGSLLDLAFSPDGAQLAVASSANVAQLWDTASGALLLATVGHTNYMAAAVFSPDSATLAIADWDKHIWQWDTASRQELHLTTPLPDMVGTGLRNDTMLAYSPDGSLLASTDGFSIALSAPVSGAEIRRLTGCKGMVMSFAFSPDSALLAVAASDGLCLYDVATGVLAASFVANDWLNTVAFSPDQTMIATTGKDHTARVYGLP